MNIEDIDEIKLKIEELKKHVKDDRHLYNILNELENFLSNPSKVIAYGVYRLNKYEDKEKYIEILDRMRENEDIRIFSDRLLHSWKTSRVLRFILQVAWIVAAAVSFMMGVYLFFPPYIFFGRVSGNFTTILQRTMELVSKSPQILLVIDPLFKVLGFAMMIIAIISLYQAHLISREGS